MISFYEPVRPTPPNPAPSDPSGNGQPATGPANAPGTPPTGGSSEPNILGGNSHTQAGKSPVTDYANKPMGSGSVALGDLVGGKLAMDLIDAIVPALLVLMFRNMGIDVKKGDMQTTEKEKNSLAPVVEACMRTIHIDFNNPWQTLAFSFGIVYGAKCLEHGVGKAIDKKNAPPPKKADEVKAEMEKQEQAKNNPPPPPPAGSFNQWTEADLKKVSDKRKKGKKEAMEWLNDNWVKMGCALPF